MKLTEKRLKQIIKEELEETMMPRGSDPEDRGREPTVEDLDGLLTKLFNVKSDANNLEQYDLVKRLEGAIEEFEYVISSLAGRF